MSNELRIGSVSGLTVYAAVLNENSRIWNGSTFEVYTSGNYANYDVAIAEQGSSGIYIGDFPSGIVDEGHYEIFYFIQDGGAPAEGDRILGTSSLDWDGSGLDTDSGSIVSGAMSGSDWLEYLRRGGFKRTDKDQSLLEATTDTITDIRSRIVTEDYLTETTVSDLITILGDYRIDLESDFGLLVSGIVLQDSAHGKPLNKISKAEFDRKYTGFGTVASVRGVPEDFCIFGGQILIGPVPNTTAYTYVISYSEDSHAEITEDTVSVPYTNKYRETLKYGVFSRVYSDLKSDDQAAKYGTLYESKLAQWEKREDRNRSGVRQTRYKGA